MKAFMCFSSCVSQTRRTVDRYNMVSDFRSTTLPLPPPQEPDNHIGEDSPVQSRPHLRQLALQCAAAFSVLSVAWPYFGLRNEPPPWPETAFLIGVIALLIARFTRQPWWWRLIHAVFAPLAWLISAQSIDPGWFLLAFILLLLVYRGALSGQIPLYLSNTETAKTLSELCADTGGARFIDLGAGFGSIVIPLARILPKTTVTGVENAPATWLIGYLRTITQKNCLWRWGNLWHINLGEYEVVYAFLSPAPMPALWGKIQREMRTGTLFISNSFPIPEVDVSRIIEVNDARGTRLFCYRR